MCIQQFTSELCRVTAGSQLLATLSSPPPPSPPPSLLPLSPPPSFFHLSPFPSSHQVGVLDIDICGPSMPKVMGLEGEQVHMSGSGWSPVVSVPTSIHFLECRLFHVGTLIRAPPLGGRSTSCTKVSCVMHQSGTNLT